MSARKARFIIIGSGWRALYYVRIAKALPQQFELCAMLCRSSQKADRMAEQHGITTTTSVEECLALQPDFAVVAVSKASIAAVSMEWLQRGVPVLCETPAALVLDTLRALWALHQAGAKLVVAEQYTRYPVYGAILAALRGSRLGEPQCLNLSLAHEYHAASLMRAFLRLPVGEPFTVRAKTYRFATAETLSRTERFTDGRIADKSRTAAAFEFASGKVCFYDFDSEQYRSPIRRNHIKLQGVRGELLDHTLYELDAENQPRTLTLAVESRHLETADPNPNLHWVEEITSVKAGSRILYTPPFGLCGLTQDETAIALLMRDTAAYARGEGPAPAPLAEALQDAYTALLMQQAAANGTTVASQPQPWQ